MSADRKARLDQMYPVFEEASPLTIEMLHEPRFENMPDAVRPRSHGYSHRDRYAPSTLQLAGVPAEKIITASLSAENIVRIFLEIIERMNEMITVELYSAHGACDHDDELAIFQRQELYQHAFIDHLHEYSDMLVHDGCTSVNVRNTEGGLSVELTDHKLIVARGDVEQVIDVLRRNTIPLITSGKFIDSLPHIHYTSDALRGQFESFTWIIGAEKMETTAEMDSLLGADDLDEESPWEAHESDNHDDDDDGGSLVLA